MATKSIAIRNIEGEKVGTARLDESVFGVAPNIHVLHEVCRAQMASSRAGTHDTKTRGQVAGGGKKPFRQKGTGRARQGTIRAPHYKGGGVVFGPHPRSYAFKVNGKEVKLALRSALSAKRAEGVLHVIEGFDFEKPSTKEAVKALDALGIDGRITLVLTDVDANAFLSFRNIPRVRVLDVADANTYDFIDNKALVFTKAALKRIEEVLQQ
jgi:large subunit ribosomal protein L4